MIKLLNILIESKNLKYEKIDSEISNLFRNNPPKDLSKFLDNVNYICLKNGVRYEKYLKYLQNKRKKNEI